MRREFNVGDLVGIDPGYSSGILLREDPDVAKSTISCQIERNCLLVITNIEGTSVRVLSSSGNAGWTQENRLRKIL